jgi:hypothetical protein
MSIIPLEAKTMAKLTKEQQEALLAEVRAVKYQIGDGLHRLRELLESRAQDLADIDLETLKDGSEAESSAYQAMRHLARLGLRLHTE